MSVLEGYILPEKENEENRSDEEDEEDTAQEEMFDMEEMFDSSSENFVHHARLPARCKVLFRTLDGETLRVTGRFALRAPWWLITCSAQCRRGTWTLNGAASYKIRTDLDKDGWKPIVSLFLVACQVPPVCVTEFFQQLPKECGVDLNNLLEVVKSLLYSNTAMEEQIIIRCVTASVEGNAVRRSFLYPNVMQYLPVLLPRHFLSLLLGKEDEDKDKVDCQLSILEGIIKEDVWKLGFPKLGLGRWEAQLQAFKDCGLLGTMPRLQHDALWAYDELKRSCKKTGSTYMEKDRLCGILRKELGIPDDHVWETLPFLRDQDAVALDKQKVALKKLHNFEAGIADSLGRLVTAAPWEIPIDAEEVLRAAEEERRVAKGRTSAGAAIDPSLPPVALDPFQLRAAEMICANPVTVISGKGGCGKTTLVSLVFRAAVGQVSVEEDPGAPGDMEGPGGTLHGGYEDEVPGRGGHDGGWTRGAPGPGGKPGEGTEEEVEETAMQGDKLLKGSVLLTAPTGRAASLLTQKTGFTAYTLHQVIWNFKSSKSEAGIKHWKFQGVRVLVVDEGSMVPVSLLHSVLSMLIKHAKLQKFVLLGDVRQLPSIQPGNTLHDLFNSLKSVNCTLEMMKNHRSESQLIVQNAQLIADIGRRCRTGPLNFDLVVDLHGSFSVPHDKKFIHIRLPRDKQRVDLQTAVEKLIGSAPGLDNHSTSQFIAFRRMDVALINELCSLHYNTHKTKSHGKELEFQVGDKVCVTKNAFILDAAAPKKSDHNENHGCKNGDGKNADDKIGDNKIRLCNGEIFFITQDLTWRDKRGRKEGVLTLDDHLGRTVEGHYQELLQDCKLRHAWARTIHTFQGSESETVVYVLGASWGQSWRHVYTAVTRGQKRVYVVSTDESLDCALKWRETPRLTRLAGLVKEKMVKTMPQTTPSRQWGSPLSTPQKPSPQVPAGATPVRDQATPFPFKSTCRRLWNAEDCMGDLQSSEPLGWSNRGTEPGRSSLGTEAAAAETDPGTPPKRTKVSSGCQ